MAHPNAIYLSNALYYCLHADLEGPDVDCDVIAHGRGTRVSSHATTDVG